MGYICCLGGFIEPSKSLGGKYEPSEKFRGQKQTLFNTKYSLTNRFPFLLSNCLIIRYGGSNSKVTPKLVAQPRIANLLGN
jgi:hypothetical protein